MTEPAMTEAETQEMLRDFARNLIEHTEDPENSGTEKERLGNALLAAILRQWLGYELTWCTWCEAKFQHFDHDGVRIHNLTCPKSPVRNATLEEAAKLCEAQAEQAKASARDWEGEAHGTDSRDLHIEADALERMARKIRGLVREVKP